MLSYVVWNTAPGPSSQSVASYDGANVMYSPQSSNFGAWSFRWGRYVVCQPGSLAILRTGGLSVPNVGTSEGRRGRDGTTMASSACLVESAEASARGRTTLPPLGIVALLHQSPEGSRCTSA